MESRRESRTSDMRTRTMSFEVRARWSDAGSTWTAPWRRLMSSRSLPASYNKRRKIKSIGLSVAVVVADCSSTDILSTPCCVGGWWVCVYVIHLLLLLLLLVLLSSSSTFSSLWKKKKKKKIGDLVVFNLWTPEAIKTSSSRCVCVGLSGAPLFLNTRHTWRHHNSGFSLLLLLLLLSGHRSAIRSASKRPSPPHSCILLCAHCCRATQLISTSQSHMMCSLSPVSLPTPLLDPK